MKRFFALVLALALALGLCACAPQQAQPDPDPTAEPAPVLAFFGASTEPWCESLREAVAGWCKEEGWALIEYDCLGIESTQNLQLGDLLRCGGADLAVLCALGDQESLEAQTATLTKGGVEVITLSDKPLERPEGALCHLGPEEAGLWRAAADFFGGDNRVILLLDSTTNPLEGAAGAGLESLGATVLETVYTWGSVEFGGQFLAQALARHNRVGGVLCFSRTGALSARAALDETGRQEVKLLCLDGSQALWDDLARGDLDGLLTLDAQEAAQALETALTQAAEGKVPVGGALPVEVQHK